MAFQFMRWLSFLSENGCLGDNVESQELPAFKRIDFGCDISS